MTALISSITSIPLATLILSAAKDLGSLLAVARSLRKTTKFARVLAIAALMLGVAAPTAEAHVGNKDVFETVQAGPYKLFVTIRTPAVIPGVATIEVRSDGGPAISGITITPLLLVGEASKHPPTPDAMKESADDAQFFTGSLWLMGSGSWQVRFGVTGAAGYAAASVPVAAAPVTVLHMQRSMGLMLGALGLLLTIGLVGIVAASVREARLTPGVAPDAQRRKRAMIAGVATAVLVVFAVYWGGKWWNVEAADYADNLYKASELRMALNGDILKLQIGDPDPRAEGGWQKLPNARLLLDHGKIMHLYAIRWPQMDAAFHPHPTPTGEKGMVDALPAMPAGDYKLFGDIVYINGFPETETAMLTIPAGMPGGRLDPDDASAMPPPLSAGELGASYKLPDGYTMVWEKPAEVVAAKAYALRFTLLDPAGKPASDMQPYLGMAGHAAFVKTDGTAFAHTHPEGSAAMPALQIAEAGNGVLPSSMPGMDMSGQDMAGAAMPVVVKPTVEFPYGFPSAGRYRVFVQMKHGSVVETGVFDVDVR